MSEAVLLSVVGPSRQEMTFSDSNKLTFSVPFVSADSDVIAVLVVLLPVPPLPPPLPRSLNPYIHVHIYFN